MSRSAAYRAAATGQLPTLALRPAPVRADRPALEMLGFPAEEEP